MNVTFVEIHTFCMTHGFTKAAFSRDPLDPKDVSFLEYEYVSNRQFSINADGLLLTVTIKTDPDIQLEEAKITPEVTEKEFVTAIHDYLEARFDPYWYPIDYRGIREYSLEALVAVTYADMKYKYDPIAKTVSEMRNIP